MRVRSVFAVALAAACAACGDSTSPHNQTVDVFTVADSFSPSPLTIAAGDTVRWNFAGGSDGMGHNIRFTPAVAGAPSDINVHKTGTATSGFTTKGDFKYVCDVHPGMNGEVIVQ